MMTERRWPSLEEVRKKAKEHVLDDRMAAVPPYELQDWEVLGVPAPDEIAAPDGKPRKRRRTARRR